MQVSVNTISLDNKFATFCDKAIILSICAAVFVLPAAIAYLEICVGLAIFFYLLKKINKMVIDWPVKVSSLGWGTKLRFVWEGLAPPDNFLNRPLQILTLAVFVSVVLSQYPSLSFVAFIGKFLKCIFMLCSFLEVFNDEKRIRIFLGVFLVSALITCLSGIVQHYTGRDFIKGNVIAIGIFKTTERISSSLATANSFGAYLLPAIALVIHFFVTAITRKRKWLLAVVLSLLLAVLLVCLCWTYSRSSWIGYLFILFFMVMMDWRKLPWAAILLVIFIFVFIPSLNHSRNISLIRDEVGGNVAEDEYSSDSLKALLNGSGSGRMMFWKKAISIIRTSPIYGTGLNTYGRIIKKDPDQRTWWYAHNSYLQMTAETGAIGLIAFLWMMFVLFQQSITSCKQIEGVWPLTFLQGALTGLFGYLVQSFFDNTFYAVQLSILLWMLFALIVALTRLNYYEQQN